jgi:hypothetical protein
MGDPAVPEDVVVHAPRGSRSWPSRLVERITRRTRLVTVIAGPHEETCRVCEEGRDHLATCPGKRKYPCVLYTAFGGPPAPQEPGDPSCKDPMASTAFWREHALAR